MIMMKKMTMLIRCLFSEYVFSQFLEHFYNSCLGLYNHRDHIVSTTIYSLTFTAGSSCKCPRLCEIFITTLVTPECIFQECL